MDALGASSRVENAACGRRLVWMGELYARRAPDDDVEKLNWAVDGHANVVAEISAALNISRGRASGQLQWAIALRERLPKVAEVLCTGAIDFRMMAALVNRSDNVTDPDLLAKLDAAFSKWAPKWMKMSGPKLTERIDMWVEKFDPTGVREPRPTCDDRYVDIGPNRPGMAGIWGNVSLTEGAALDERLDQVADTVCRDDPRSARQRRADALMVYFNDIYYNDIYLLNNVYYNDDYLQRRRRVAAHRRTSTKTTADLRNPAGCTSPDSGVHALSCGFYRWRCRPPAVTFATC